MVKVYFLDSYAIIEIIKDNKNYDKFKTTVNLTNIMNLLEVHYFISKDLGNSVADSIINKLKSVIIDIDINDIKDASNFRLKNIKKKFSFIDCLSYIMAKNRGYVFVTGDKEFKDLPNVEFVK